MVYEARFNIGDGACVIIWDPDERAYYIRTGCVTSVTFTDWEITYSLVNDGDEFWADEQDMFATQRGAELAIATREEEKRKHAAEA